MELRDLVVSPTQVKLDGIDQDFGQIANTHRVLVRTMPLYDNSLEGSVARGVASLKSMIGIRPPNIMDVMEQQTKSVKAVANKLDSSTRYHQGRLSRFRADIGQLVDTSKGLMNYIEENEAEVYALRDKTNQGREQLRSVPVDSKQYLDTVSSFLGDEHKLSKVGPEYLRKSLELGEKRKQINALLAHTNIYGALITAGNVVASECSNYAETLERLLPIYGEICELGIKIQSVDAHKSMLMDSHRSLHVAVGDMIQSVSNIGNRLQVNGQEDVYDSLAENIQEQTATLVSYD